MTDIFAFIVSQLREMRRSFRWIAIVLIIFMVGIGVLGYERITGALYYARLERRINLLKELQLIEKDGIVSNKNLYPIYKETVDALAFDEAVIIPLPFIQASDIAKALGASFMLILLAIVGAVSEVQKTGKLTGLTIAVVVIVLLAAVLFGFIGVVIPDLLSPWMNVVLYILIQLLVLRLISKRGVTVRPN